VNSIIESGALDGVPISPCLKARILSCYYLIKRVRPYCKARAP
jgi:hypothetical protein